MTAFASKNPHGHHSEESEKDQFAQEREFHSPMEPNNGFDTNSTNRFRSFTIRNIRAHSLFGSLIDFALKARDEARGRVAVDHPVGSSAANARDGFADRGRINRTRGKRGQHGFPCFFNGGFVGAVPLPRAARLSERFICGVFSWHRL